MTWDEFQRCCEALTHLGRRQEQYDFEYGESGKVSESTKHELNEATEAAWKARRLLAETIGVKE